MNSASIRSVTCDLWHETREHAGSMAACRTHRVRIVAISLIYPLHPHADHTFRFNSPTARCRASCVRFRNIDQALLDSSIKAISSDESDSVKAREIISACERGSVSIIGALRAGEACYAWYRVLPCERSRSDQGMIINFSGDAVSVSSISSVAQTKESNSSESS
jgi:hypothetical protein